jgi:Flp pilus assembly protein protease CpaA
MLAASWPQYVVVALPSTVAIAIVTCVGIYLRNRRQKP